MGWDFDTGVEKQLYFVHQHIVVLVPEFIKCRLVFENLQTFFITYLSTPYQKKI
jgi:hypothetical protein